MRSVVVACTLEASAQGMNLSLPTYVLLASEETGLESEVVATPASPFTLPKGALVDRFSVLSRRTQSHVDKALRLAFGYEEWPL